MLANNTDIQIQRLSVGAAPQCDSSRLFDLRSARHRWRFHTDAPADTGKRCSCRRERREPVDPAVHVPLSAGAADRYDVQRRLQQHQAVDEQRARHSSIPAYNIGFNANYHSAAAAQPRTYFTKLPITIARSRLRASEYHDSGPDSASGRQRGECLLGSHFRSRKSSRAGAGACAVRSIAEARADASWNSARFLSWKSTSLSAQYANAEILVSQVAFRSAAG